MSLVRRLYALLAPRFGRKPTRLRRALSWVRALVLPRPDQVIAWVLQAVSDSKVDIFFIQVGSNDGMQNDPLRPFVLRTHWRGILIEPLPHLFERLTYNYRGTSGLLFEQVAIDTTAGDRLLYYVREGSEGETQPWHEQIGSLSLSVVEASEKDVPRFRERLTAAPVVCTTIDALCAKHAVRDIDILHVDTEGHDFKVIRTANLSRYKPSVILYEHQALTEAEQAHCKDYLRGYGYALLELDVDTLAISRETLSANARLAAVFRRADRHYSV